MKRRWMSLIFTGIAAMAAVGMLAGCGGNGADSQVSPDGKSSKREVRCQKTWIVGIREKV